MAKQTTSTSSTSTSITTTPVAVATARTPRPPSTTGDESLPSGASMSEPIGGLGSDPDSQTGWMTQGNCRLYAPATFFPSDGVGVDRARKICASCPVIETCLEYALTERIEHGVWGGCSERERRRILRRRQLDAAER